MIWIYFGQKSDILFVTPHSLHKMGVTNILQRRIKPIKDASDDEETNSILPESQLESDNPDSDNSVSSTSSSQGGRSHQHEQHKTKEDGTTHQSVRKRFFLA